MRTVILALSVIALFITESCSTNTTTDAETSILWVSGFQPEADAGAAKRPVLLVHRGENLDTPKWEYFYSTIEGFEFVEGALQQIEITQMTIDKSEVPADASSIKYTLVKVLQQQEDSRLALQGQWTLAKLNDGPLNRMLTLPTMTIDLKTMTLSGNNGCNNFTGRMESLGLERITTGAIATTKKMCANKNIEPEFNAAISSIQSYQFENDMLTFLNGEGASVLSFIKAN